MKKIYPLIVITIIFILAFIVKESIFGVDAQTTTSESSVSK
ncbi:MAG: hypothetical protein ACJAWW_000931 [Sulfurimonas sp.]|jgi:hypothetical protein